MNLLPGTLPPPHFDPKSCDLRTNLLDKLDEISDIGKVGDLRDLVLEAATAPELSVMDFLEVMEGVVSAWEEIRQGKVVELDTSALDEFISNFKKNKKN
jgi:hypothetical protein